MTFPAAEGGWFLKKKKVALARKGWQRDRASSWFHSTNTHAYRLTFSKLKKLGLHLEEGGDRRADPRCPHACGIQQAHTGTGRVQDGPVFLQPSSPSLMKRTINPAASQESTSPFGNHLHSSFHRAAQIKEACICFFGKCYDFSSKQ